MAWSGLVRAWDGSHREYRVLVLRIEDTDKPGWLGRLYEGDAVIGEELADSPQQAIGKLVERAQKYLEDPSIGVDNVDWVQI
jgi:hypothetical protein